MRLNGTGEGCQGRRMVRARGCICWGIAGWFGLLGLAVSAGVWAQQGDSGAAVGVVAPRARRFLAGRTTADGASAAAAMDAARREHLAMAQGTGNREQGTQEQGTGNRERG
jgi:hypothetical protein